jgi:hypothetical protein
MEIVPAHLAVTAMRDNGYKNAAYALAELMDNSIQAKATVVELLCMEREELVSQRRRLQIYMIGVLDNGSGMDEATLQMSLQFGNGMNLAEAAQTGMGKFGMGLPASSVSQAKRVEVWTWQAGVDSAIYAYLDIDLIASRKQREVPKPVKKKIPKEWLKCGASLGESGTLIVWSAIDKCKWATGKAIIDNSELIVGRMYRKFLDSGKVTIRMATFDWNNIAGGALNDRKAVANDPLYLMARSSTDAPYDLKPMFEPFPTQESYEHRITVRFRGRDHNVYIRTSMATKEARLGTAGNRSYGRHAQKNMGVSVVRAMRELELDANWAQHGDVRERWWGVEVEFSPGLDELFGVTNNKQNAHNFAQWAHYEVDELLLPGETITSLKQRLADDEDPSGPLLEVAQYVQSSINEMRKLIQAQNKNTRRGEKTRHGEGFQAEKEATAKTRERQAGGIVGRSDAEEGKPEAERIQAIGAALEAQGLDPAEASTLAATTVGSSLKYVFAESAQDSPAFFSVQMKGGALLITLNTEHSAYDRLVDVLERDPTEGSQEKLAERLNNALEGLKLLLMAWARYEDEQGSGIARQQAQDARLDWGKIARRFMDAV